MRSVFVWAVFAVVAGTDPKNTSITIVMSTGNGLWNTGVWSGYGEGPIAYLRWASEGITVDKTECRAVRACGFTHDQSKLSVADVVLMETVNHPKFLGSQHASEVPFPFPKATARVQNNTTVRRPLFGMFYFEPSVWYPAYTTDNEFRKQFDLEVSPRSEATLPISMMCLWNNPYSTLSAIPHHDFSSNSNLIAWFAPGEADPFYRDWVYAFARELDISMHVFGGPLKNAELPGDCSRNTPQRIRLMSTYKFVFISEAVSLDDWVAAEYSQAIVAGAVPVYIGAPNILEYSPGVDGIVNVREWYTQPPKALADYLRGVGGDEALYSKHHGWRRQGPTHEYTAKLKTCVFEAECRICEWAAKALV